MKYSSTFTLMLSVFILCSATAAAQENIAQQTYAIFEQNCLNYHGEHGAFTEEIIIDYTLLIETVAVVLKNPLASVVYRRLLTTNPAKRMPSGQPQLLPDAILMIGKWILAGALEWEASSNGRSGRVAYQFVADLAGRLALE